MTAKAPQKSCPLPMRKTADATAPTVPVIVTMSGVTPARARRATTGAQKRATAGRVAADHSDLPGLGGLSDQAAARRVRVSLSTWGSTLVAPMTGMKLVSPPHRGHGVLVQVVGDSSRRRPSPGSSRC